MNGLRSNEVVIMDFTGVYDMEAFLRKRSYKWVDCRHLSGTDCYCDEEGKKDLQKVLLRFSANGIHFIDSGNYHYVTKFWTDKITEPFTLIVFDHHPDMQPSLFENLLSCGSWVKEVLDCNVNCRKVIVVGASDKLIASVPHEYGDRVRFYSDAEMADKGGWKKFASEHIVGPVYISIDKDVLSPEYAVTNWDQGSMSLPQLARLLKIILHHHPVIGIDICGEFASDCNIVEEEKDSAIDERLNKFLLNLTESSECALL